MSHSIRADFDAQSIVVYQAYNPQIASAAVAAQKFVPPFSLGRMTWIKPSFLWMMERSNWGRKPGQECILAVRITREGWEEALSLGVLTHPEPSRYPDADAWRVALSTSPVRIQWDPERSLKGGALDARSIQVGLSRHIIQKYVDEWTVSITDLTPRVRKMATLLSSGNTQAAQKLLPPEKAYPLSDALAQHICADRAGVPPTTRRRGG